MSDIGAAATRTTYFGAKASTYDADREHEEKWRNEHAAVAEFLDGYTGRVLDIPVGTGRFLSLYRSLGLEPVGRDVSEEMMVQARAKDPAADIAFGDVFDIEFPDRSFDVVVCVRLLNLITQEEMQQAVAELCRVADAAVILSIRTGDEQRRQRRSLTHLHEAFDKAISAAGFMLVGEKVVWKGGYRVVLLTR